MQLEEDAPSKKNRWPIATDLMMEEEEEVKKEEELGGFVSTGFPDPIRNSNDVGRFDDGIAKFIASKDRII